MGSGTIIVTGVMVLTMTVTLLFSYMFLQNSLHT